MKHFTITYVHISHSKHTHHMGSIPYGVGVCDPGEMKVGGAGGGRGGVATPGSTPRGMCPGITPTGPLLWAEPETVITKPQSN